MNKKTFNPDRQIADIIGVPETLIQKLKEYNIVTIGQLLGSTKGFTMGLELFERTEKEFLIQLMSEIPEKILREYKEHLYNPQLGCFPPIKNIETDEKKEE